MSIQRAYCSMSFLEDIIKQRKQSPHKIAYELLNKLCDIYVDVPKQDIIERINSNDVLKALWRRENRAIRSFTDAEKQLKEAKADDLFFFSEFDKKFDKKRVKEEKMARGIFMATQSDMYLFERVCHGQYRPFNLAPKKLRHGEDVEFESIDSWEAVFDDIDISPINAAVITDNFMFKEKFPERKRQSLYAILKCIVPSTLEIPFHLTIFFNTNNGKLSKDDADAIVDEIHNLNLCKEIKVSIVSHLVKNTTHDREILTNYHYIHSGAGFSVIDANGVQEVAKGEIKSVYHCISSIPAQTTVKHLHTQMLEWLKQIYYEKRGSNKLKTFKTGDDFENRLLSD